MSPEPFLLSLRDLEILRPAATGGIARARVSVRLIVNGFTGTEGDRFDLDEVADLVRAYAERGALPAEVMAREIRDEVLGLRGVASAVVSVSEPDRHSDAEAVCVSTLPDPRHAVLYGVLP